MAMLHATLPGGLTELQKQQLFAHGACHDE